MAETDELSIPDAAKRDPKSFELLRVWITEKGQHVSLRTSVWSDPAAWGIMLVDLAPHRERVPVARPMFAVASRMECSDGRHAEREDDVTV